MPESPLSRIRKYVLWSIVGLGVVGLLLGLLWRHYMAPERLRRMAQSQLTKAAGAEAVVAIAHFSPLRGLILRDIRIEDINPEADLPLARIDTMLVAPVWSRLLKGDLTWRVVEIEGVDINAQFDSEGRWPFLERLARLGRPGVPPPTVYISRAHVRVTGLAERFGLPDISFPRLNARFQPVGENGNALDLVLWSEERARGRPRITARFDSQSQQAEGRISITGLSLDDKFRASLPPRLQAVWDDFGLNGQSSLAGKGAFTWNLQRAEPLHLKGKMVLDIGGLRHRLFPYPMRNLRAEVQFEDFSFRVNWFHASAGQAEVSGAAAGTYTEDEGIRGEATVRTQGLELDDTLRSALPAALSAHWERLRPGGLVDVMGHVSISPGANPPPLHATVSLRDCSASPPEFPFPLTDIRGELTVDGRTMTLRNLAAKIGEAPVRFENGYLSLDSAGPFLVAFEVAGLRLHKTVRELLCGRACAFLNPVADSFIQDIMIGGSVEATFHAQRRIAGTEPHTTSRIALHDATLSHPALERPLRGLSVSAQLDDEALRIAPWTASWGPATVSGEETRLQFRPDAARRFVMLLKDAPVDAHLRGLLGEAAQRTWDRCAPEGVADVSMRFERPAGPGLPYALSGVARVRDGRLRHAMFPYPLDRVTGELTFTRQGLRRCSFNGRHGETTVSGVVQPAVQGAVSSVHVVIQAKGLRFDEDLKAALPPSRQALWELLAPEGVMDLDLVEWLDNGNATPGRCVFQATAAVHELSLKRVRPLQLHEGRVSIRRAEWTAASGLSMIGRMDVRGLLVENTRIANLGAAFAFNPDALHIEDVSAECFQGRLRAELHAEHADDEPSIIRFDGSFDLEDADVEQAFPHREDASLAGKLRTSCRFTGSLDDVVRLSAEGEMILSEARLVAVPGILAVVNLFHMRGLDAPLFHTAKLVYELRDDLTVAHELNLIGDTLSLNGSGRMDANEGGVFNFHASVPEDSPMSGLGLLPITVRCGKDDALSKSNPVRTMAEAIRTMVGELLPLVFDRAPRVDRLVPHQAPEAPA